MITFTKTTFAGPDYRCAMLRLRSTIVRETDAGRLGDVLVHVAESSGSNVLWIESTYVKHHYYDPSTHFGPPGVKRKLTINDAYYVCDSGHGLTTAQLAYALIAQETV